MMSLKKKKEKYYNQNIFNKYEAPFANICRFNFCSNVVYKFSCSCDTNKTYIGMSSRHLITRVREHLNFKSLQDSAIKDHILSCEKCSNNRFDENNFVIIRKCKSEFCSKIHEALLIKK